MSFMVMAAEFVIRITVIRITVQPIASTFKHSGAQFGIMADSEEQNHGTTPRSSGRQSTAGKRPAQRDEPTSTQGSSSTQEHRAQAPGSVRCFVLTVSDTRTAENDGGGALIQELLRGAGHEISGSRIVVDEVEAIASAANDALGGIDTTEVLIVTGGSGIGARDVTPEALRPLLTKDCPASAKCFACSAGTKSAPLRCCRAPFAGVIGPHSFVRVARQHQCGAPRDGETHRARTGASGTRGTTGTARGLIMVHFNDHPGWDIHEDVSDEMDFLHRPHHYPWRMRIRRESYEILKDLERTSLPDWMHRLFYEKDGHEYYRAVDNHVIPYLLHYRIIIDDSLPLDEHYGTKVEMDDEMEPDVRQRYRREAHEAYE
jgi:molybdenum cofactor biosynthesis protein B